MQHTCWHSLGWRSVPGTAVCTSFLIHFHNAFTHVRIPAAAHYLVDLTGIIVDARNLVVPLASSSWPSVIPVFSDLVFAASCMASLRPEAGGVMTGGKRKWLILGRRFDIARWHNSCRSGWFRWSFCWHTRQSVQLTRKIKSYIPLYGTVSDLDKWKMLFEWTAGLVQWLAPLCR